jgi:GDP-L-fucose synthase
MKKLQQSKILLTGGYGFLGKFVFAELVRRGVPEKNIFRPKSKDLDLRVLANCEKAVKDRDGVIHLAANFGGLKYNIEHAAEVFYDNSAMGLNLLEAAHKAGVEKMVVAGTVGSYPKAARVPYREEEYWNGLPEEGNGSYGMSKKFVSAQFMAYRQQYGFSGVTLLLANLYGPEDHFELSRANVVPALIHKILDAEKTGEDLVMWGTGKATREFLFVEDAARAVVLAAEKIDGSQPVLNIGSGQQEKIKTLAETLAKLLRFKGRIVWDKTKPEGQRKRVMDVKRAEQAIGFQAKTSLQEGLKKTIAWYRQNKAE